VFFFFWFFFFLFFFLLFSPQHLIMVLNKPKHVVIYVCNKARWSTVANEGCFYLLIIRYIEESNDLVGNRIWGYPACSIVHEPTVRQLRTVCTLEVYQFCIKQRNPTRRLLPQAWVMPDIITASCWLSWLQFLAQFRVKVMLRPCALELDTHHGAMSHSYSSVDTDRSL
jgi:hypothetical protein